MPIKPENKVRYPADWKQIRQRILDRDGHKCRRCGIPNYAFRINGTGEWSMDEDAALDMAGSGHTVTRIVLTIAHLNHVIEDCSDENLQALCQAHHLAHDQAHHQTNAWHTRRAKKRTAELF